MNLIHALQDNTDPNSLVTRFRRARARRIVDLIQRIHARKGAVSIIDLGGEANYWTLFDRAFLDACKVRITLVNPGGIDETADPALFEIVDGDACDLPHYADHAFDLVHSNSVIEHVGDWGRMEAFAASCRRLAPAYYVQTPYFWFPVEPHFSAPFFHWRSEQSRARALLKRGHGFSPRARDMGQAMRDVQHARLLDKGQFRFLYPDAVHHDEVVAGMTKSLIAVRAPTSH
ncbi:class I SAM-dependent methyltransferase [Brevundimonas sp. AJA228-03]|uniref:class I SAM-dependent methyltransferase n=1 Tax=Brevundimonas sp. AJA228-03 TaxID=2752515 RepID=UPI001ADF100E|nr:class I SAM-dependent methyltransferase [Brevundimonas sp. AJA228-03]QTN19224.1 class I SAM-dependent methyltransferase [Brevundimonas sp. AJA228-03]